MPVKRLALILSAYLLAATASAESERWYQVEVLVFANNTPQKTDEIWPLLPLQYPRDMVTIAPQSDDGLSPYTLEQLAELEAYQSLFGEDAAPTTASDAEFLFESRSRFPNPVMVSKPDEQRQGVDTNGVESEIVPEEVVDFSTLFQSAETTAFKDLPQDKRLLNNLARSLRRSSLYRLLTHQSWVQPIGAETTSVLLQAGKHYDDTFELDGTIDLSRSRYLHVNTNLWFTEFAPLFQSESTAANLLSPMQRSEYPRVAEWEASKGQYIPIHSHPLQQSRRMRSATLHFIDHPHFGVLVKIENFERGAEQETGLLSATND